MVGPRLVICADCLFNVVNDFPLRFLFRTPGMSARMVTHTTLSVWVICEMSSCNDAASLPLTVVVVVVAMA